MSGSGRGWSLATAAEAAGVSARRAREWRRRWEAGDTELEDRTSMAHALPGKTPADVEEAICALRDLRFSGTRIAEALGMPESVFEKGGQGMFGWS